MQTEEVKRGPGRPPKAEIKPPQVEQVISGYKHVRFVQMHDAFTPLQMAPIMSLSVEGARACKTLHETWNGIYVEVVDKGKTRSFTVPFGNVSFYEHLNDKGE